MTSNGNQRYRLHDVSGHGHCARRRVLPRWFRLDESGLEVEYWVEFEAGGSTFGVGNFAQVGTAGSAQSLALEVPDLVAFRKELSGRHIASSEPFETPVCWISAVRDPDGNQVWLHQRK